MLELKLKKYRRFIEDPSSPDGFHAVTFRPGLTIVTGQNGAGKTTLVEALGYALYGPKQGQKAEIVPDGLVGGTEVTCELDMDGHSIKVWRSADRAALWIDDQQQVKPTAGSISAVDQQLKALLGGLSQEHFEHTYFARQGDTAGLVEAKEATRRETISQILQLDVLQKAIEIQGRNRNDVRQQIKERGRLVCNEFAFEAPVISLLESHAKAQTPTKRREYISLFDAHINDALKARAERVETDSKTFSDAKVVVAESIKNRDAQLRARNEARDKLTKHEQLESTFNEMGQQVSNLHALLSKARTEAKGLEERVTAADKCVNAAHMHEELMGKIAVCTTRLAALPRIRDRFERLSTVQANHIAKKTKLATLAHLDDVLTQIREDECAAKARQQELELDPTLEDYNSWRSRKAALEHQEHESKSAVEILGESTTTANCPTCDHPLDEHQRADRKQHLSAWLASTLPGLQTELKRDEDILKRRHNEWTQAKREAVKDSDDIVKKLYEVKRQIDERSAMQIQLAEVAQEEVRAQSAWDELEEHRPYDETEAASVQAEKDTLSKREAELKKEADQYARLGELQSDLANKEAEIEKYAKEVRQKTTAQEEIGYDPSAHKVAKDVLKKVQDDLEVAQDQLHKAELQAQTAEYQAQEAATALKKGFEVQETWQKATADFCRADQLHTLLADFLNYYFDANTKQVSERASELILCAVTDGSILGIEFDKDGHLYYFDASHHRRLVTKARPSGGEKAMIGLCLRIALAEQARAIARTGKLSFLVLDEVLSPLDDERRDAVQRIFEEVQRNRVFQHIILITHLQAIKDQWQAVRMDIRKLSSGGSQIALRGDDMLAILTEGLDSDDT